MKTLLFILSILPITIYSQNHCVSFFNGNNIDYQMSLKENKIYFYRFLRDDYGNYWENEIYHLYYCHYRISNDTLIVYNCYYYYQYGELYDPKIYYFKITEDGILKSLSDFSNICKIGDIFYCKKYEYEPPERLSGSPKSWANGKKNGGWFYVDSLYNLYRVTYKDDVVIQKEFLMKTYNKNP
jgi:hypothetical protein